MGGAYLATWKMPPAREAFDSRVFLSDRVFDSILERFWCQKGGPKRDKNRKKTFRKSLLFQAVLFGRFWNALGAADPSKPSFL